MPDCRLASQLLTLNRRFLPKAEVLVSSLQSLHKMFSAVKSVSTIFGSLQLPYSPIDSPILPRPIIPKSPRNGIDQTVMIRMAEVGNTVSRWVYIRFSRRLNDPVLSAFDGIIGPPS